MTEDRMALVELLQKSGGFGDGGGSVRDRAR
jgi:hypothetical protein